MRHKGTLEGTDGRGTWGATEGRKLYRGTLLHLYTVTLHADQETRRKLGPRGASVEESGGGMCEPALAQQVVCLDGAVNVSLVNAH